MRKKCPVLTLVLCFAIVQTVGCKWLSRPSISGVWRGSIEGTDKRGHKWQGPAELTLNQNEDAITGTLVFTPPQAGRVQVPISSGRGVQGFPDIFRSKSVPHPSRLRSTAK